MAAPLVILAGAGHAHAQQTGWLLPDTRHFRHGAADPLAPRFGVGLLSTDLLRSRGPERPRFILDDSASAAREVQATAALGATLPLVRLGHWPGGGAVLAAEAAIFARFRIEEPSRDELATDWFVRLPVELRHHDWSGRIALMHRSAHLGDEFMIAAGAERIEFGHEALELTAARHIGATRLYGGGAWIFRSNTVPEMRLRGLGQHDRLEVNAGAEHVHRLGTLGEVRAGIDARTAERTDWQTSLAVVAGIGVARDGRALRLIARFHDGVSQLGEFFLTSERYLALELVVVP